MFYLDYYKDLIDVVITFKHCNKYDLDEILMLLPDDDIQMIELIYQEYLFPRVLYYILKWVEKRKLKVKIHLIMMIMIMIMIIMKMKIMKMRNP